MAHSPRDTAIANATSRSGGAVGSNAVVPKLLRKLAGRRARILDFGAGKHAAHAQAMKRAGYNVTAHDFGQNQQPGLHDPKALSRTYDAVGASNVLNVQPSPEALRTTLSQIAKAVRPGGLAVVNYPASPRKLPSLSTEAMAEMLRRKFRNVEPLRAGSPTWKCQK